MTPSRLLKNLFLLYLNFTLRFQIFDAIHFDNIGERVNDPLGELDNFYRHCNGRMTD